MRTPAQITFDPYSGPGQIKAGSMEPDKELDKGYAPEFSTIWGAILAIVVAYIASTALLLLWIAVSGEVVHSGSLTIGDLISSSMGTWIGFFGAAVIASRTRGTHSMRADYGISIRPMVDVPLGIVSGLALQFLVLPAIYLPLEPLIPHLQSKLSGPANYITSAGHGAGILAVGLVIVVGAPIVEEIFFRGLLLQSISVKLARFGKRRGAIFSVLLSSVAFGIAHVEPLQLLGLTAVGIVLATLRIKFNRLGPGMITHATFNFITFAALYHK